MGKQNELIGHWLTCTWAKSRRPPTPLDGAYCNALLLANWSVRQKRNHASSAQFSYVALFAPSKSNQHFFGGGEARRLKSVL